MRVAAGGTANAVWTWDLATETLTSIANSRQLADEIAGPPFVFYQRFTHVASCDGKLLGILDVSQGAPAAVYEFHRAVRVTGFRMLGRNFVDTVVTGTGQDGHLNSFNASGDLVYVVDYTLPAGLSQPAAKVSLRGGAPPAQRSPSRTRTRRRSLSSTSTPTGRCSRSPTDFWCCAICSDSPAPL